MFIIHILPNHQKNSYKTCLYILPKVRLLVNSSFCIFCLKQNFHFSSFIIISLQILFFRENAKDITFHFTKKKEFITFLLGGSNYRKSAANILCRRQDYPSPFVLDLALCQTFSLMLGTSLLMEGCAPSNTQSLWC
jgi:hypothetical protein